MCIGILLILNSRGEVVLSRAFRDGYGIRQLADIFRLEVIATKKVERSPVVVVDKMAFIHLRFGNMIFVACTNMNADVTLVFQYMLRLIGIFKTYFTDVTEDSLRDNFVAVQHIIDESLDYGYPQLTEPELLKGFITAGTARGDPLRRKTDDKITIKATGNIPWRSDGIVYRENEAYLDVFEEVNLLMSQSGQVLQREVIGKVVMRSFLSGMPECHMCINDSAMVDQAAQNQAAAAAGGGDAGGAVARRAIVLDDVTFHPCVHLGQFDVDRSIVFVPPDGESVLLKYRSSESVKPPFTVGSARVKEVGNSRMEIDFMLRAEFQNDKASAKDIEVKVPCPNNTATVKVRISSGKAKYDAPQKAIIWKIKKMTSGQEMPFSCEIILIQSTLPGAERVWSRPPICMSFFIPSVAVSGLQITSMRVTEPKLGYKPKKLVRYFTNAGQYQCRL